VGFGAVGRNNEESERRGSRAGQQHWAVGSMRAGVIVVGVVLSVVLVSVLFAGGGCSGRQGEDREWRRERVTGGGGLDELEVST
jgi:hypothetical protein